MYGNQIYAKSIEFDVIQKKSLKEICFNCRKLEHFLKNCQKF